MVDRVRQEIRIYYGDETVWIGADIEDAARLNVQAISWEDPDKTAYSVGRCVLQGADYYVYVCSQMRFIQVLGETDLVDHVLHSGPLTVFKGRTIRDDIYRRIIDKANNDEGIPLKSATNKRLEGAR